MRIKDGQVGIQGVRGEVGFANNLVAFSSMGLPFGSPGQLAEPDSQALLES